MSKATSFLFYSDKEFLYYYGLVKAQTNKVAERDVLSLGDHKFSIQIF